MQQNKVSRKTSKTTVKSAPEQMEKSASSETVAKSAPVKPAKKNSESAEAAPKKNHRRINAAAAPHDAAVSESKAVSVVESAPVVPTPAVKTMAAAAGSSSVFEVVSEEQIAKLAHSYWVERGHHHGSAEEDWLRAERALKSKA